MTTGVSAATSSRRFGSSSGRLARWRVEPKAASFARSQRMLRAAAKNSMSLGFEPGQPPSMYGMPNSSSIRATRSLSASERMMFSPWVPSRRVVSYRTTGWSLMRDGSDGRRAERVDDGRGEGRRADHDQAIVRVRGVGQVGRPAAVVERGGDGGLDGRRGIVPAQRPAQQHGRREDRPDRVGQVLAGDVRRGAVDRLVQAEQAVRRPPRPRATPTAASRGSRPAPTPRRRGCRRRGSR